MTEREPAPGPDERADAALLASLRATPSPAARARAFAKLQQEFAAQRAMQVSTAARRFSARHWKIAAGIAVLAGAAALWTTARPAPRVANVEAIKGVVAARGVHWFSQDLQLGAGANVGAGDSLVVENGSGALLRVSPDLTLRLAAGTRARFAAADELDLSAGQVFVDATPGARTSLRVVTPHGVVTHLGTQYLVRATPGEVEVAVREGRAALATSTATRVAETGQWLLLRATAVEPLRGDLGPNDARFDWIAALPTDFRLQGATLEQFLAWFHRESGLTPVYSDGVDAGRFAHVLLKGSIHELEPLEALSYVLATADLSWHREGAKVFIDNRAATGH